MKKYIALLPALMTFEASASASSSNSPQDMVLASSSSTTTTTTTTTGAQSMDIADRESESRKRPREGGADDPQELNRTADAAKKAKGLAVAAAAKTPPFTLIKRKNGTIKSLNGEIIQGNISPLIKIFQKEPVTFKEFLMALKYLKKDHVLRVGNMSRSKSLALRTLKTHLICQAIQTASTPESREKYFHFLSWHLKNIYSNTTYLSRLFTDNTGIIKENLYGLKKNFQTYSKQSS